MMSDTELVARLAMALLFGALVGIERQWHHKNAGLKTNTLVTVGAAAFALISLRGFGPNANPAQVAAGVVTGVGFIGAGVMMRRGSNVQGINTAATLWAAGSLGLSIGMGYYTLSLALLAVIIGIQVSFRWLASLIDRRSELINPFVTYRAAVTFASAATDQVRSTWQDFARQPGVAVSDYAEARSDSETTLKVSFGLSEKRGVEIVDIGQKLAGIPGVTVTQWSACPSSEADGADHS